MNFLLGGDDIAFLLYLELTMFKIIDPSHPAPDVATTLFFGHITSRRHDLQATLWERYLRDVL